MARMPRRHRAATRLRDVADEQPGPAVLFLDSVASRSTSEIKMGWPHMRLRESRMTCQAGPSMARDFAPERQPLAYQPMARAASGAGVFFAPNSSLAGVGFLPLAPFSSLAVAASALDGSSPDFPCGSATADAAGGAGVGATTAAAVAGAVTGADLGFFAGTGAGGSTGVATGNGALVEGVGACSAAFTGAAAALVLGLAAVFALAAAASAAADAGPCHERDVSSAHAEARASGNETIMNSATLRVFDMGPRSKSVLVHPNPSRGQIATIIPFLADL